MNLIVEVSSLLPPKVACVAEAQDRYIKPQSIHSTPLRFAQGSHVKFPRLVTDRYPSPWRRGYLPTRSAAKTTVHMHCRSLLE
jgi:hypothetical protein